MMYEWMYDWLAMYDLVELTMDDVMPVRLMIE